ncbi:MAG: O-methyltransferase [Vicinamibacterales bacterium]
MSEITPPEVGAYLASLRREPSGVLARIDREGRAEGLPLVLADTGALLHALARACGARRILEIGTAIGYSTIWLASAMPDDGLMISMEMSADRAARARAHFVEAGLEGRVSVIVGDAAKYLHKVSGPFDVIFQDSDKQLYEPMLDRLVALLRPGGLLLTDNVLWSGEVIPEYVSSPKHDAADTEAIAAYNRRLAADSRLFTTFVQVGDGLSISVKL